MDCPRFEAALIEQLEGALSPVDRETMRAHVADCEACRALQTVVIEDGTSIVEPADLTSSILAVTSGPVCARVQELSSERAGATLSEVDEALDLHLGCCPQCSALARALERLRLELPRLVESEPEDGFVDGVLAVTTHAPQRRSPWERFARRPRLALEGAYAGTLALFLVVGFPGAPLGEVAPRLLSELGRQRIEVQHAVANGASWLHSAGRRTLTETAQRFAAHADICEPRGIPREHLSDITECWRRAGEERIATSWRVHVKPVIDSIDSLRRWARVLFDSGDQAREQNDGTTRTFL
ncbi:MAG TPA: zf-HC2 domain-containing protein [Acidobacteriota bacterium]|nr:zf-HC2 domain-containing protein [Acidobacteriota bacterium]